MRITRETYLAAQQLLNEAKRRYGQLRELEEELGVLLKVEDEGNGYYGYVSDAIYGDQDWDIKSLLKRIGYTYGPKIKS